MALTKNPTQRELRTKNAFHYIDALFISYCDLMYSMPLKDLSTDKSVTNYYSCN
jgi:hypothetical protein